MTNELGIEGRLKISLDATEPTRTDGTSTPLTLNTHDQDLNRTFNPIELPQASQQNTQEEEAKAELMEELYQIEIRIAKATKETQSKTEKEILLRELRKKKRDLVRLIADLVFKKECDKYSKELAAKKKTEKQKSIGNKLEVETSELASLTLNEENKDKYNRGLTMCHTYRTNIVELFQEIDELMDEETGTLTDVSIEDLKINIQTKLETMKSLVTEYKKQNQEIAAISDVKDLPQHINNLQYVLNLVNELNAKQMMNEEKLKRKLALSKSEQLEGLKVTKFNGMGDRRYMDYYCFYQEISELVLKKPYSDSTKLKYLKQYLEGDALQIVKNYHQGKELDAAFKALDNAYGRPDMVIRECLRNIRNLELLKDPIISLRDIRTHKRFINLLNTNISTLKCYNFDIDGSEQENSSFIINIEEKLGHDAFLKWEEEKVEIRNRKEKITVDKLIEFLSERIRREEHVNYVRQTRQEEDKKPFDKARAKILSTDFKVKAKPKTWARSKPYQNSSNTNVKTTYQKDAFCHFCEKTGHSTGFCKVHKYSKEFKEEKCRKHNACYACLKTTEHKSDACPNRRKCLICGRFHHFNLHARQEIQEYYDKKKKNSI